MARRVLVVEDDASVREAVTLVLEKARFAVETAPDGAAGLDAFERGPWDLVLLDLMLPPPDGFALCEAIRARSTIPIVVLTARRRSSSRMGRAGRSWGQWSRSASRPRVGRRGRRR